MNRPLRYNAQRGAGELPSASRLSIDSTKGPNTMGFKAPRFSFETTQPEEQQQE